MRRPRPARRGYALIEMVLVMGSMVIVLGLCALTLHALLRLDAAGRAFGLDQRTVTRLAERFRDDVRAARSVKAEGELALTLEHDDASVVYRVDGPALRRELSRNGEVTARERYDLTRLGPARLAVDGRLVSLALAHAKGPADGGRPPLRIEAATRRAPVEEAAK